MKHPTKGKTLARDLLSEVEIQKLIAACGGASAGLRNRAFIAFVAGTGARVSEALSLEPSDLHLRKRRAMVRSKGGRRREIWIHPDCIGPIREWNRERTKLGLKDSPLFCNLSGDRISAAYFRSLLRRLGQEVGIDKRVHPDGLRNDFARRAFDARVSLRAVQQQLGHANIATTLAYMESLGLHGEYDHFESLAFT